MARRAARRSDGGLRQARHRRSGKHPCTTQQEDNATLTALERGAEANLVDFNRIAILRTASNFDREAPGQSAADSLRARSGGYLPSVTNAYRVCAKLAHAIVADWATWRAGPPK